MVRNHRVTWSLVAGMLGVVGCSDRGPGTPSPVSGSPGGAGESTGIASASQSLVPVGWTRLPSYPGGSPEKLQLLMDGSVLAADGDSARSDPSRVTENESSGGALRALDIAGSLEIVVRLAA